MSVLENKINKIHGNFEIQTDRPIPARGPNFVLINKNKKKTFNTVKFAIPADRSVKIKESEKIHKYKYTNTLSKNWKKIYGWRW